LPRYEIEKYCDYPRISPLQISRKRNPTRDRLKFMSELLDRIERLNEIGIALSAESDTPKLLELIMMGAKSLTHADGGSLYF